MQGWASGQGQPPTLACSPQSLLSVALGDAFPEGWAGPSQGQGLCPSPSAPPTSFSSSSRGCWQPPAPPAEPFPCARWSHSSGQTLPPGAGRSGSWASLRPRLCSSSSSHGTEATSPLGQANAGDPVLPAILWLRMPVLLVWVHREAAPSGPSGHTWEDTAPLLLGVRLDQTADPVTRKGTSPRTGQNTKEAEAWKGPACWTELPT